MYGSYSKITEGYTEEALKQTTAEPNIEYYLNETYQLNSNNTYHYIRKEIILNKTTQDINQDSTILSIKEISDDISKITLDWEILEQSKQEFSNQILYKYKNMAGDFCEIEVPHSKTFELHLNDTT